MKLAWQLAAALLALTGPMPDARAQAPVPLPTDPSLAAYVASSGAFQSQSLGQQRTLTLRAWMAAYAAGESIDFASMTERAFLTLDLPDEGGWGLLTPVDDQLTVSVHITDALGRLGRVRLTDHATGALLAELPANAAHTASQGSFPCDSAVREIVATLLSASDATLARMAVDLGKFDAIAWYPMGGGFQPYCPAPIACSRYVPMGPPGGDDYYGTIGDPTSAAGTLAGTTMMGASRGCACADVTNDEANVRDQAAPLPYSAYFKRDVILNSVPSPQNLKMGDPAAVSALATLLASLTTRDLAGALGNAMFPPYSTGFGYWQIDFAGQATAILAVPFERVRKGGSWSVLIGGVLPLLQPTRVLLSSLLVSAANDWLANQLNQQSSKFRQGDVFALGDVYALTAAQRTAQPRGLAPILAPVTLKLKPDIAPGGGGGIVTVANAGAWTTPAPPGPANGGTLNLVSPPLSDTLMLAKGYNWRATGNITSPIGYQPVNQPILFATPASDPVEVPCTLTVLLKLTIVTTGAPAGATIKPTRDGSQTTWGVSAYDAPTGKWVLTRPAVAPGHYELEATFASSGGTWKGTTAIDVEPDLAKEVTIAMTKQ